MFISPHLLSETLGVCGKGLKQLNRCKSPKVRNVWKRTQQSAHGDRLGSVCFAAYFSWGREGIANFWDSFPGSSGLPLSQMLF